MGSGMAEPGEKGGRTTQPSPLNQGGGAGYNQSLPDFQTFRHPCIIKSYYFTLITYD